MLRWRERVQGILQWEIARWGKRFRPNYVVDAMQRGMLKQLARQVDWDLSRCLDYTVGTEAGVPLRRFANDLTLVRTIYDREHFEQSVHQHEVALTVLKRMEATLGESLSGLKAQA